MWHAQEPSMMNGHEFQAQVKNYIPSPAIVMSPYEWKILELDEKPQPNKTKTIY